MLPSADWPAALPAARLIEAGLRSLRGGVRDDAALLICIGASELRRLGVNVPDFEAPEPSAELCLYLLLAERHGDDAHNQYNSLIQQLVSFERALALERHRVAAGHPRDDQRPRHQLEPGVCAMVQAMVNKLARA